MVRGPAKVGIRNGTYANSCNTELLAWMRGWTRPGSRRRLLARTVLKIQKVQMQPIIFSTLLLIVLNFYSQQLSRTHIKIRAMGSVLTFSKFTTTP
jgi:hypothetical protein